MKILSERKRSHQFDSAVELIPSTLQLDHNSPSSSSSTADPGKVKGKEGTLDRPCQYAAVIGDKDVVHVDGQRKSIAMSTPEIYHEKQVRALCALHALNNLFQGPVFAKADLDSICDDLAPNAWVNPHKSALGLGDYDINVIMTALQKRKYDVLWFDKRKDPGTLALRGIFGFILNIPTDCKLGWIHLPLNRKHWYAVRVIGEDYYKLDSKLAAPQLVGNDTALITFFRDELQSRDKELFLVIDQVQHLRVPDPTNGNISSSPASIRKESADSGVVELLEKVSDLTIVDLTKEEQEDRFS